MVEHPLGGLSAEWWVRFAEPTRQNRPIAVSAKIAPEPH
jgi:hypothetical protein